MKKLFFLVLCLSFILCSTALASEWAVTHDLGGDMDRVKLREKPNSNGKVLAQYFEGVYVEILSTSGQFSKVRIGGKEGYMMTQFLKTISEGEIDYASEGLLGMVRFTGDSNSLPLYEKASEKSNVIGEMPKGYVNVLATVDDNWLHISYKEDGQYVYGYASAWHITQTDNLATCYGDTGDAEKKISLRSSPSTSAKSVGQYFCGTTFYILYDNNPNNDKFTKVRVDDAAGFILSDSLNFSTGGIQALLPPLSKPKKSGIPFYDSYNSKKEAGALENDCVFSVIGIRGDRYHIRLENTSPSAYCYVNKKDVTDVSIAAKATGTLKTAFKINDEITAPKGAKVYIHGEGTTYLQPDCQSVTCTVEYKSAHLYSTVSIPTKDVNIDPLLFFPK